MKGLLRRGNQFDWASLSGLVWVKRTGARSLQQSLLFSLEHEGVTTATKGRARVDTGMAATRHAHPGVANARDLGKFLACSSFLACSAASFLAFSSSSASFLAFSCFLACLCRLLLRPNRCSSTVAACLRRLLPTTAVA
jgi:hypothetical protein